MYKLFYKIVCILVFILFVYKHLTARNRLLTIATKLVIGMCFGSMTMIISGVVENFRQEQWQDSTARNQSINALTISFVFLESSSSNLTVFAQLPQIIGMGISELFVMVASFEYAYVAAPRSAQSLFMSLRFCSVGISSFINAALIKAFSTPSIHLDYSVSVNVG